MIVRKLRRAADAITNAAHRRRTDRAFADGFARHPETPGEMADAARLAVESIEDEPWERW